MKTLGVRHACFAVVAAFFLLLAVPAAEADLILSPTTEFSESGSPATIPAGEEPTATFTQVDADTVMLTMQLNFTSPPSTVFDGAKITEWDFNITPDSLATDTQLEIVYSSGTSATVQLGTDSIKPDGDGFFDFGFLFSADAALAFDNNDTSVWLISCLAVDCTITEQSFNTTSENGPVGKTGFTTAAHIQSIGATGAQSGWYGDGGTNGGGGEEEVPAPAGILLLGVGLVGLTAFARRRNR